MKLPTTEHYNVALQNPALCFDDQNLRDSTADLTKRGVPRPITGNFAAVYRVRDGDRSWAVRCFLRGHEDQHARYKAINDHLRSQSLPQAVEFEYLDRGVKVEGTWHPILKMEWVEGTTLERYVEQKLDDPQALSVIATQFAQLLKDLTDREIAHGDLQHGNILVTDEAPGPRLRVIDYDAMWVPALRSHTSHELGHRNYQHPARTRHDYGPDTDAFSAWSITLSLASLAADPTLWRKLDAGDERLLLGKDDYRDPLSSKAFVTLGAVSTAPVSELADRVAHLAIGPSASGLPFPVLDGVSGTASSRIAATGTPWYRNVPHEWWRQRPTDLVLLSGTRHVERATAVAAALAVVLGLLAGVFGTAPDVYALGVVLLAGLSLSASVTVGYFYLPEVRGKYRTVRSCRDSRRAVRRAELELEQVDARETSATSEECARVRAIEDGMKRKAIAAQQHRTAKAEELRRTLGQAATEKKALRAKQQKALDRALRDIRVRETTAFLRRQRIAAGQVPGIGEALTARLRDAGIASAADFTGIRVQRIQHGYGRTNSSASIKRSDGREVRVEGIGEAKASALDAWRRRHERAIEGRLPSKLPAADERRIRDRSKQKARDLDTRIARAKKLAQRDIEQGAKDAEAERAALERDLRDAKVALQKKQAPFREPRDRAARRLSSAKDVSYDCERDLRRYQVVTFRTYLKTIIPLP